jgi:hypothetical protein|tara:strand:+ start:54 stop:224 length:171 start_codon:yes stop_codon:yes gene_type:complete
LVGILHIIGRFIVVIEASSELAISIFSLAVIFGGVLFYRKTPIFNDSQNLDHKLSI